MHRLRPYVSVRSFWYPGNGFPVLSTRGAGRWDAVLEPSGAALLGGWVRHYSPAKDCGVFRSSFLKMVRDHRPIRLGEAVVSDYSVRTVARGSEPLPW
jgi:hypothetical protein